MKIANIVFAILFSLFAAVQYNDPDPWRWAMMYSYVAIVCGLAALGKRNQYAIGLGLLASTIWALCLMPEFLNWLKMGSPTIVHQMKAETPYVEFTREFLGLTLCILTLAWQFWLWKRKEGTFKR